MSDVLSCPIYPQLQPVLLQFFVYPPDATQTLIVSDSVSAEQMLHHSSAYMSCRDRFFLVNGFTESAFFCTAHDLAELDLQIVHRYHGCLGAELTQRIAHLEPRLKSLFCSWDAPYAANFLRFHTRPRVGGTAFNHLGSSLILDSRTGT